MSDWTPPSPAELDQQAALAIRPENRAYFFDRLENPEWVSALSRRGVFDATPDLEAADEPGYVQFPPWPEAATSLGWLLWRRTLSPRSSRSRGRRSTPGSHACCLSARKPFPAHSSKNSHQRPSSGSLPRSGRVHRRLRRRGRNCHFSPSARREGQTGTDSREVAVATRAQIRWTRQLAR